MSIRLIDKDLKFVFPSGVVFARLCAILFCGVALFFSEPKQLAAAVDNSRPLGAVNIVEKEYEARMRGVLDGVLGPNQSRVIVRVHITPEIVSRIHDSAQKKLFPDFFRTRTNVTILFSESVDRALSDKLLKITPEVLNLSAYRQDTLSVGYVPLAELDAHAAAGNSNVKLPMPDVSRVIIGPSEGVSYPKGYVLPSNVNSHHIARHHGPPLRRVRSLYLAKFARESALRRKIRQHLTNIAGSDELLIVVNAFTDPEECEEWEPTYAIPSFRKSFPIKRLEVLLIYDEQVPGERKHRIGNTLHKLLPFDPERGDLLQHASLPLRLHFSTHLKRLTKRIFLRFKDDNNTVPAIMVTVFPGLGSFWEPPMPMSVFCFSVIGRSMSVLILGSVLYSFVLPVLLSLAWRRKKNALGVRLTAAFGTLLGVNLLISGILMGGFDHPRTHLVLGVLCLIGNVGVLALPKFIFSLLAGVGYAGFLWYIFSAFGCSKIFGFPAYGWGGALFVGPIAAIAFLCLPATRIALKDLAGGESCTCVKPPPPPEYSKGP